MRKFLPLIVLSLLLLSHQMAFAAKFPVKYLQLTPNIQTVRSCYKVEEFEEKDGVLYFYFEESLSDMLFDESFVDYIYSELRRKLPKRYRNRKIKVISKNYAIEDFIPNHRRKSLSLDSSRIGGGFYPHNVVRRLSLPYKVEEGLQGRNIALWPSHGLYFNIYKNGWDWQRPRLFGTVEDVATSDVVLNYLLPMFRSAGADIFMPRERDLQTSVVDAHIEYKEDAIICHAKVPSPGMYWLKIWFSTYGVNPGKIECKVVREGLENDYEIDVSAGNGTWIYLDELYFEKDAALYFDCTDSSGFCLDSVRLGGGYSVSGNGMPAYVDGARYYLQRENLPDSILYCNKEGRTGDYYDDIYSRARWVNHLAGGSPTFPGRPGLSVPVDACLAIHTDASATTEKGYEGSLLVCTADSLFPNGQSRMASNDLAYYIAEQIISDFDVADSLWAFRGIWHRMYVESRVPQTPSNIIEMWSHDNFEDVKKALDPRFRFDMARAVYKALLKYLAAQDSLPYCVQPLPVKGVSALFAGDSARLSWQPRRDCQESTAIPSAYVVYTRVNGGSFDNGRIVKDTIVYLPIMPDSIYSFKITAVNAGGESFPSEVLSLCKMSRSKDTVMVVNCFDRVSGPASFETDSLAGFLYDWDFGVPYMRTISYTGKQYEFRKNIPYAGNDYPGFGASMTCDKECAVIAGNNFDYPYIHGKALSDNGYSFVSCSKNAVMDGCMDLSSYKLVDLIAGLQRNTDGFELFPKQLQAVLFDYVRYSGGKLIVSGAYIASSGGDFAKNILNYKMRAPWEAADGKIQDRNGDILLELSTEPNAAQYFVQSVESLNPVQKGADVLLQYSLSKNPAALGYDAGCKIISLGFPIEAVIGDEGRSALMKILLEY